MSAYNFDNDYQIKRFTLFHNTAIADPKAYPALNSLIEYFKDKSPTYVANQFKKHIQKCSVLIAEGKWERLDRVCNNESIRIVFPDAQLTPEQLARQPIELRFLARIICPEAFPKDVFCI